MATETEVTTEAPAEVKKTHRLEREWAFWCDVQSKPKQGAAWGDSLRKIYTFSTVEEFWRASLEEEGPRDDSRVFQTGPSLPSKLSPNADIHLFKEGVQPKWEDPVCAGGGKWTVTSNRKANLDLMWQETLMALIGEQFDEADEICGVVASVRKSQDKLALWTKTAANEAVQMSIGKKWKEIIDVNDKINYSFHDDSKKDNRSAKSRYSI